MDKKCRLGNTTLYLLMLVISLILTGCGPANIRVQSITPDLNIQKSATNAIKQMKVAVNEFKIRQGSSQSNVIGEAKVGGFNKKVDIISDEPVSVVFTNAIRHGFDKAGFTLAEQREADYIVDGEVEKFWVEEYATGLSMEYSKGYVRYDVVIRNTEGKTVWANTMEEFNVSEKSMDTTQNDIPTLTVALQASVESIFKDAGFWKNIVKEHGNNK